MAEVVDALLRANLVAAAVILAVMALRAPARRRFGPEMAYRLWAAPPLAALATLIPLRTGKAALAPLDHIAPANLSPVLLGLWGAGVVLAIVLMARAQAAFLRAARQGRAGPAVVGVLAPRVVMPPDDGRFSEEERALIRAHERTHISRDDPRAGAVMALFQCLAWFNPLVHVAAHLARLDQELACDAAVMRRHPTCRVAYAKTLLKTQLAAAPLPLGCYWPARSRHPLELRVEQLCRPVRERGVEGGLVVLTGVLVAALAAIAVEPPIPPQPPRGILAAWDDQAQHQQAMSVMLISWPARTSAKP
ncbi:M56 family metallopeptidase [Phenylobacterium soli]|uniref:Peptidase M56 n=1 Tax=Phenylobacterium soli TaxID=2170551 RepID=A0A328AG87_9CAUL|nr:M56 family metallopeptidase [Phenylobacterium soli]RAK53669.1 peptidase M56 [Phenylobacterium soli]